MPHKRKKGRKIADEKANEAPNTPLKKRKREDMGNRRLDAVLQMAADIRNHKPRFKDEKATEPTLKIRPHESVADFNRRVNTEYQPHIAATFNKIAKKKKKEVKKQMQDDQSNQDVQELNPVKEFAKHDITLRFGEQAQAPPTFTVLPKARPKRTMDIEQDIEKQRAELSRKRIVDAERKRVIDTYRKAKKERQEREAGP